jgi:hypothetical protein
MVEQSVSSSQKSGRIIKAKEAIISNADLYNTYKFVPKGVHEMFDEERDKFLGATAKPSDGSVPYCKSFMHLHLGVKAELIPEGEILISFIVYGVHH